ncbi:MAG TPA: hypothetical protein DDX71_06080 [Ruminococcus sp.]|nr:hypothetical protein [Ruminococcus sp.]
MVGDKGWLSASQEMNILPRPYKWETGNTLPKQYERLAEKLLQKTARNEKRNSAALMIAVGGFTLLIDMIKIVSLLLGSGHSIKSAAFLILWNAFAAFIIYRLFDYKQIGALSGDLQSGSFRWRTGKLDEIAAEVVDYRGGDDDPSKPVLSVFAYADGVKLENVLFHDMDVKCTAKDSFKQTKVEIACSGGMQLGDDIIIVDAGGKTLILPRNVEFDEH